jgi:hypothetical protein
MVRRSREISSIDGDATATIVPGAGQLQLVEVRVIWRNRGLNPVVIDPQETTVRIYDLTSQVSQPGHVDLASSSMQFVHEARPHEGLESYVLEPATDSLMQSFFALEPRRSYIARVAIAERRRRPNAPRGYWTREVAIQL